MTDNAETSRLADLMEAMVELSVTEVDLEVWATPAPEPFTIRARLKSDSDSAVLLSISCDTSCIHIWPPEEGDASESKSTPLVMQDEYEWAGLRFPTASLFARVLVQRMRDELPTGSAPTAH